MHRWWITDDVIDSCVKAFQACMAAVAETKGTLVHPFDDSLVIAGQASNHPDKWTCIYGYMYMFIMYICIYL
jgi:hypothetical protein